MLVEVATGMRRHPGIKCLSDTDSGRGWRKEIPSVRLEHTTSCWRSGWAVSRFEKCDEYVLSLAAPKVRSYQAGCLVHLLTNYSSTLYAPDFWKGDSVIVSACH
jgi:hypothetical protein